MAIGMAVVACLVGIMVCLRSFLILGDFFFSALLGLLGDGDSGKLKEVAGCHWSSPWAPSSVPDRS